MPCPTYLGRRIVNLLTLRKCGSGTTLGCSVSELWKERGTHLSFECASAFQETAADKVWLFTCKRREQQAYYRVEIPKGTLARPRSSRCWEGRD